MESVNSTVTVDSLAEPVQRLIRSLTQTISPEELNLLQFISVKDVNVVYAELAADNDAETVWHQLRTALQARQRRSLHRDQQANALSSLPHVTNENSNEMKAENNHTRNVVESTITQPVHHSGDNDDTKEQLNADSSVLTSEIRESDSGTYVVVDKETKIYSNNIVSKSTCDHSSAEPVCQERTEHKTHNLNSSIDVLTNSKTEKASAPSKEDRNELQHEHPCELHEEEKTREQTNSNCLNTYRAKEIEKHQAQEQIEPSQQSELHDQQGNNVIDNIMTSSNLSNAHAASVHKTPYQDHNVDRYETATESHSNFVTPHKTYASYLASEDSSDDDVDVNIDVNAHDLLYSNNNIFSHPLAIKNVNNIANANAKLADDVNDHNNLSHTTAISLTSCNNLNNTKNNMVNDNSNICYANKSHENEFTKNINSVNGSNEITQKKLYHILNTPPKQSTDLLRRVYGAKCPECGTRFAHPPPEWDCPLCLRKLGERVKVWQPDESSEVCMLCHRGIARFSRHHCRSCGRLTCSKCCTAKAIIHGLGFDGPVKVCDDCAKLGKEEANNSSLR